jgi:hypothetical protein
MVHPSREQLVSGAHYRLLVVLGTVDTSLKLRNAALIMAV